jgi:hypothetical protein
MCVCHGDPDGQFGGKETGQAEGKQAGKRVLRGLILTAAASIEKWVKRERVREGGEGEREREREREGEIEREGGARGRREQLFGQMFGTVCFFVQK